MWSGVWCGAVRCGFGLARYLPTDLYKRIPRNGSLATKTSQAFGANVITEGLSEYIAIALLLVSERAKGEDSFWSSYIGVLPSVADVSTISIRVV